MYFIFFIILLYFSVVEEFYKQENIVFIFTILVLASYR